MLFSTFFNLGNLGKGGKVPLIESTEMYLILLKNVHIPTL